MLMYIIYTALLKKFNNLDKSRNPIAAGATNPIKMLFLSVQTIARYVNKQGD